MAVDISTPPEVFETVRTQLADFFKTNAGEYSGNFLCVANFAGDPLKYTLVRLALAPHTLQLICPLLKCTIS